MTGGFLRSVALVATLGLFIYILRFISLQVRVRRAKLEQGCKDPVKYPHTDRIRGSDLTALRKQALREGCLKKLYLKQHRALGDTWQETVDGNVVINTINGRNLQYIHSLHMSEFGRSISPNSSSARLFGTSVFLADGNEWKWSRKRVEPTFSKYEKSTMPMLKTHVDRFISELPRDGRSFDAQPLIKSMFLDLTTEFLFGEPLGMQFPEKRQEGTDFLKTLDSTLLGLNKRRQGFGISTMKLYFDGSYASDVAKVHAFVDDRVRAALARTSLPSSEEKLETDATDKGYSKAGRFILVDMLAKQIRDPGYLRNCMLQCFLPGRDNTAILMSNTLFGLARHPEYWERLRPIALALSEDDTLSFSKLSALYPLRHVILEALRLYGPGGATSRRALTDLILPKGGGPDGESPLFVSKGVKIQTHLPTMHRNKRTWGDDADDYRPERFDGYTPGWEFKPFLAGPRTCPAKDQVMVQATYILVRLLREFKAIENRDEVVEFVEMSRMTTESRRGAVIALLPSAA